MQVESAKQGNGFAMKNIFADVFVALIFTFGLALAMPTMHVASAADNEPLQTAGEYFDDSVITTAVKSKILGEKGLSSLSINVVTKDGVVTLSGKVDTGAHSDLAVRVAKKVNGVSGVVNNLLVTAAAPQSVGEYVDDASITAAVKANILKEKGLSTLNISVETKDNVVTLTGKIDSPEHSRLATRVAKRVDGVKSVVNRLKE